MTAVPGEDELVDARTFGRLSGCTSMYSPAEGVESEIVRAFSSVQVFGDEQGAEGDFADAVNELEDKGGQRFDAGSLGDDAAGVVNPSDADAGYTQTRVIFRIRNVLATVALHEKTDRDASAELRALAEVLNTRVERLLSS